MKRTLLLAMVLITSALSCSKQADPQIGPISTVALITATVSSDVIYHPSGTIVITWQTTNMPAGSTVYVEIYEPTSGRYIPLVPQNIYGPPDGNGTADDGHEIFNLTAASTGLYDLYGRVFQILIIVQHGWGQTSQPSVSAQQYSQLITIVPDGCTATTAYSTTTGQSCTTPVH